jgi:hypothetical protein
MPTVSIPTALLEEAKRTDCTLPHREKSRLRMIVSGRACDFHCDGPDDPNFNRDVPWEAPPELSAKEIAELQADLDPKERAAMGPWGRMPMDSRLIYLGRK